MRLTCPNACARKNAGVIDLTDTGRGLLHDLDAESGAFRNTTAFLSEKFARIKLLLENPAGGQLARLEKLEALALGIEGKRTLWRLAGAEEKPAL
jgi:hypothetical protein